MRRLLRDDFLERVEVFDESGTVLIQPLVIVNSPEVDLRSDATEGDNEAPPPYCKDVKSEKHHKKKNFLNSLLIHMNEKPRCHICDVRMQSKAA